MMRRLADHDAISRAASYYTLNNRRLCGKMPLHVILSLNNSHLKEVSELTPSKHCHPRTPVCYSKASFHQYDKNSGFKFTPVWHSLHNPAPYTCRENTFIVLPPCLMRD